MMYVDMVFLAWYTFEVGTKFVVHTFSLFCGPDGNWNAFDTVVVIAGFLELGIQATQLDFTFMRVLRILRIGKILRALRAVHFLRELRLMLECVLNSLVSLLWAIALMGLFLLITAVIFVQTTMTFQIDLGDGIDESLREKLQSDYSSVGAAM